MMSAFSKQKGLTLVELMIAMTLSLVLLSGVLFVFSANKASYNMQTGVSTFQENGRYALRQISDDIHMSGFSGCLSPGAASVVRAKMLASSPPSFLTKYADGELFDGINDIGGTTYIGGREMVGGTDAIEIRGPLLTGLSYSASNIAQVGAIGLVGTDTGIADNEYVLISDCEGAEIFRVSSITVDTVNKITTIDGVAGNVQPGRSRYMRSDAIVTELVTHTYFVGITDRFNSRNQQITALYRFDGTNAQELVEGVEDLQIEYGYDRDDPFDAVDTFVDSDGVADWRRILTVRVSMLVNSVEPSSATEASYIFQPVGGADRIMPPDDDFRLRQEFSGTFSVRNNTL